LIPCSQKSTLCDEYSFDESAILLAGNGDFNLKWYEGKFDAYQRTYVLTPKNKKLLGFLFFLMKKSLREITIESQGSVISFLTKGMIENYKFACPHERVLNSLAETFYFILNRLDANKLQIQTLSKTRDTLLPKLMSGQVRVR